MSSRLKTLNLALVSDLSSFSACVSDEALIVLTLVSSEPTSAPLDLFIEDKNDTSVSIIWSQPEVVGHTGLDGYLIEVAKEGSKSDQVHSVLACARQGSDY